MKSVERMIDSALAVCPSKSAIARTLGLKPQHLYDYEKGHRHMPAALVMRLATLGNLNAVIELGRYEAEWLGKKTMRAAAGIAGAAFTLAALSLAHGDAYANSVNTLLRGTPVMHYAQRLVAWFRQRLGAVAIAA